MINNCDKTVIGLDFGSLAARGVLVDSCGREIAAEVFAYPHKVIDRCLPSGEQLPPHWALQHPADYIAALDHIIPALVQAANDAGARIRGLGVAFTVSTILPVDKSFAPLCTLPEWSGNRHAWTKLWKHHAAQSQSKRLVAEAARRGGEFFERGEGQLFAEATFPKILQIIEEAPEVFGAAWRIIEAGDWLVSLMVGSEIRSAAIASCKTMRTREGGYPDFTSVNEALGERTYEKLGRRSAMMLYPGQAAGVITEKYAARWGLPKDTLISAAQSDGHTAAPALGIGEDEGLVIIGTSSALIYQSRRHVTIKGFCSIEDDCDLPGLCGYAAGQSGVGDCFAWFAETIAGYLSHTMPDGKKIGTQEHLTRHAADLRPGESGLLALDWWNGNKSLLGDAELGGLILGLTLQSTPAEIYRALIEATAFGLWEIISALRERGNTLKSLTACGGVATKNSLLMQIYADVLRMPIKLSLFEQPVALGSAIYAAAACGLHESVASAVGAMAARDEVVILPNEENGRIYDILKKEYSALYSYFGRGGSGVMHRLAAWRRERKD